jgi:hypothetical protein
MQEWKALGPGHDYMALVINAGITGLLWMMLIVLSIRCWRQTDPPKPLHEAPQSRSDEPKRLPDVFATTLTLPDGRAISSCRIEDLIAIHEANTTDQASRLLVGKWVKFFGKLRDNHGDGIVLLESEPSRWPIFILPFREGWTEQLSELQRGSNVTVRGQIVSIELGHIRLHGCELL